MWSTVRGKALVAERPAVLDSGRRVHHRLGPPGSCATSQSQPDPEERAWSTIEVSITAVRSPWCLGLENRHAAGSDPTRALYTEFAWLGRWRDGTFRVGNWSGSSLGSYGLLTLLRPPTALSHKLRAAGNPEVEFSPTEIELALIAPELVVLGADMYRTRILRSRGVLDFWEARIAGVPALRIEVGFDEWDNAVEFCL